MGEEFQRMLRGDCGIKRKPITVRNPQANAIVERVHQTIGNMIQTFELGNHCMDEEEPWKGILSAVALAVRATIHSILKKSPAQLVFGRDMMLIFRQLFDVESSTYTYLLGDSGKAILIDPVFEQIERDLALLGELGLTLETVLDTHCHADHVTGAWLLQQRTGA